MSTSLLLMLWLIASALRSSNRLVESLVLGLPMLLQVAALGVVVIVRRDVRMRWWYRTLRFSALLWCAAGVLFMALGTVKLYSEHGYVTADDAADFSNVQGLTAKNLLETAIVVVVQCVAFLALIRSRSHSKAA